jgi:glutathione synthase/RimK-type ligase-like ATP-grasp enzyme
MSIKLAIHHSQEGFSGRWIEYCRDNGIAHEIVNCYDTDIIARLKAFDGLLWHFTHNEPTDLLMARHVLQAAEHIGLATFPNTATCWHFDDKIAQKYVLEAIGAPLAPTHVFYDQQGALAWLKTARFPLVRKLRRGAGSFNVRIVRDYRDARRFCRQMFGKGLSPVPRVFADSRRRVRQMSDSRIFWDRVRRLPEHVRRIRDLRKRALPERGYVLFQEFMPGNTHDTRIAVVGRRAWGFTRDVRKGDFRASGSGAIKYDLERIHPDCVKIAFTAAAALRSQSTAFDFVRDPAGRPVIVEVSFGYAPAAVYNAPGYWEPDLSWRPGHTWPEHAILTDLIKEIEQRKAGAS